MTARISLITAKPRGHKRHKPPTVLYSELCVAPNIYTIQNSCISKVQGLLFGVMGILLLILGVFIIMGGIQVPGAGLLGLAVIGAFVISSMLVGKVLFKL